MFTRHEHRICCAIAFSLLIAVLSAVSIIYLIVFLYIPSYKTLSSNFQDNPAVCRTVSANRDVKATSNWSTCSEWCLSKASSNYMQVWVLVRKSGIQANFFDCADISSHKCTHLNPSYIIPLNCSDHPSCKYIDGLYNCSEEGYCRYITPFFDCQNNSEEFESVNCNVIERCNSIKGIFSCNKGICNKQSAICEKKCNKLPISKSRTKNVIFFVGNGITSATCEASDKIFLEAKDTIFMGKCSKLENVRKSSIKFNIYGSDCIDGVLLYNNVITHDIGYTQLLNIYQKSLSSLSTNFSIKQSHVFPYESNLILTNVTRLLVNIEGCVNTLKDECNSIYNNLIGKDGSNFEVPAIYPCYMSDLYLTDFVLLYYNRKSILYSTILFAILPSGLLIISCVCLFFCSHYVKVEGARMRFTLHSYSPMLAKNSNL